MIYLATLYLYRGPRMKAQKAIINFGGIQLEVYQLPKGDYKLSQTQIAGSIDKHAKRFAEWIEGKSPEALLCKDYAICEVCVESSPRSIKAIDFKISMLYWSYWATKGNVKAQALLAAGTEETLTRLADKAFGVAKTEEQYQIQTNQSAKEFEIVLSVMQRLEQKIDSMENELKLLRPAYEKLEKIESTLEEYPNLKEALEYLVANVHKTKTTYPLNKWLKDNNLDFIPNNVRMSIGRLVTSWCKLIEFKSPKGHYSDAFDPVLRFAVNYKLTQETK